MKKFLQSAMLFAMLASGAFAADGMDDGLDDALAALKKERQTAYSTRAVLHDQDLIVPTGLTDEDKALDDKLLQIEKELDRKALGSSPQAASYRPVPRAASRENENWLTPALLNTDEEPEEDMETDWMMAELDRQKSLRLERETMEDTGANSWLDNAYGTTPSSSPSDLESYNRSLQDILTVQNDSFGDADQNLNPAGSYSTSQTDSYVNPFSLAPQTEEQDTSISTFTTWSPTGSEQQPQQPLTPTPTPSYGSSWETPAASSTGPSWDQQDETKQLTPIERIRNSSPIYQDDPFSDDSTPAFKNSIWD